MNAVFIKLSTLKVGDSSLEIKTQIAHFTHFHSLVCIYNPSLQQKCSEEHTCDTYLIIPLQEV